MNPAIQSALDKVTAEEMRLLSEQTRIADELAKIRSVKEVLIQAAGGHKAPKAHVPAKAPPGMLSGKILSVLGKTTPKTNKQIREALTKAKYPHSLTPLHVTKHLIMLMRSKKVKRVGEGAACGYVLRG